MAPRPVPRLRLGFARPPSVYDACLGAQRDRPGGVHRAVVLVDQPQAADAQVGRRGRRCCCCGGGGRGGGCGPAVHQPRRAQHTCVVWHGRGWDWMGRGGGRRDSCVVEASQAPMLCMKELHGMHGASSAGLNCDDVRFGGAWGWSLKRKTGQIGVGAHGPALLRV